MRDINDILHFRSDISPFLVHLTRRGSRLSAGDVLKKIVEERKLVAGSDRISDARFAIRTVGMSEEDKRKFFGAVCFTETPLNEVHCLFEIKNRAVNLRPYGLVFLKQPAIARGVEPVFYINNIKGDKLDVLKALCSLIRTNPVSAARILPLISIFGKKITPPGASAVGGEVDFRWEREWRYVPANGPYELKQDEIFMGLCPHDEIEEFEGLWNPIEFIDPTRNIKWYATKLINARQRLDIKYSVI